VTAALRAILVISVLAAHCLGQAKFHLKQGDRVVFYGDSITDQRLYTTFVESFVVTRFPKMQVTFVHSGWGGDRVTGGNGGGIDERLSRDVIDYRPTVVTVMLGMNDGRYRAFDGQIFEIYSRGYERLVKQLKERLPGVRITAIQPSPFDDVTRAPNFSGGYNAVLLRYGQFVKELAARENLTVADLNGPVTAVLQKAKGIDPELAQKIVPDRVHPGPSGHLMMAGALLKAWNAPGLVSSVEIDAAGRRLANSENALVTELKVGDKITWTQTDGALPLFIDLSDPPTSLAIKSSDFMETLNRQILKVTGLPAGRYTLRIDGSEVRTFSHSELEQGVNLAGLETPMRAQAQQVHALTLKHNNIHYARWRSLQVPLQEDKLSTLPAALSAVDAVEAELVRRQRALAQPTAHRFELVPGESGFKPIFNGTDLTGWHISKSNHHGTTPSWTVENGVLTGTQDKPGQGGILLTDRKYRNFEISMELNPDFGCDGGLFLRSNEQGQAYQVMIDYLDGGSIGGIYGERLQGVKGVTSRWQDVWRRGTWNHLRVRMEGDVPHIQVWLNGVKITDWRDTANHAPGGATEGMVAVQVHGGNRWIPGGKHRFRNIQLRELP